MKIEVDLNELMNSGVYLITNTKTGKVYVGSTTNSIYNRLKKHLTSLKSGRHPNKHLLYSWNKYKDSDWKITILESCNEKQEILKREQYWIDKFDAVIKGYNLCPIAGGVPDKNETKKIWKLKGLDPKTLDLRSEHDKFLINGSFKEIDLNKVHKSNNKIQKNVSENFHSIASKFFKDVKTKKISVSDIPEKYIKQVKSWLYKKEPWNKGKKYKSTDHLKVPKKKKGDRSKDRETKRNKASNILVFDFNNQLLGEWRSSKDLEEESRNDDFCLIPYIKSKNKIGRNGYKWFELRTFNINKSARKNTPYKGLYFKFKT